MNSLNDCDLFLYDSVEIEDVPKEISPIIGYLVRPFIYYKVISREILLEKVLLGFK